MPDLLKSSASGRNVQITQKQKPHKRELLFLCESKNECHYLPAMLRPPETLYLLRAGIGVAGGEPA